MPYAVMPGYPGPAFGRPKCKLVSGIHDFKMCDAKTERTNQS
jgi:hypothetical protein